MVCLFSVTATLTQRYCAAHKNFQKLVRCTLASERYLGLTSNAINCVLPSRKQRRSPLMTHLRSRAWIKA
jgi:hypothetical protein